MQIGRGSRRSIRYSIISGVLAGSVFSGSGAFGIDLASISADVIANNNITLVSNANYEAGDPSNVPFLGTTYFGSYSGIFSGNGATISGLTVPLFDYISGSISDLNLETAVAGVVGQGILSNLASPESIIDNVSVTGDITSTSNNTGGLVGEAHGFITNSSSSGSINSSGSYIGGLVGYTNGQISESVSSMSVTSSGNYVGGLVGRTGGEVINSSASGNVESAAFGVVGGLIGYADGNSGDPVSISLSHASGSVEGYRQIGGLIGLASGIVEIAESYAQGTVQGNSEIGGLLGYAGMFGGTTTISESHSSSSVIGTGNYVGGLVGYTDGTTSITQSYSTSNVTGTAVNVGGIVGYLTNGEITDSYSTGDVAGYTDLGGIAGAVANSASITNVASTGDIEGYAIAGGIVGTYASSATLTNVSSFGSVTTTDHGAGSLVGVLWTGNINGYRALATVNDFQYYTGEGSGRLNACDCRDDTDPSYVESFGQVLAGLTFDASDYVQDVAGGDGGDGGTPPRRERIAREVREALETRTVQKFLGIERWSYLVDAPNTFPLLIMKKDQIYNSVAKEVETSVIANVKVNINSNVALQISLKSESKDPVELWVKSPDGTWLLAGVITFDKDGKAILPPLQFKNAGDYMLVLNKPSAESAKGRAPLNQSGSVLVAVS